MTKHEQIDEEGHIHHCLDQKQRPHKCQCNVFIMYLTILSGHCAWAGKVRGRGDRTRHYAGESHDRVRVPVGCTGNSLSLTTSHYNHNVCWCCLSPPSPTPLSLHHVHSASVSTELQCPNVFQRAGCDVLRAVMCCELWYPLLNTSTLKPRLGMLCSFDTLFFSWGRALHCVQWPGVELLVQWCTMHSQKTTHGKMNKKCIRDRLKPVKGDA